MHVAIHNEEGESCLVPSSGGRCALCGQVFVIDKVNAEWKLVLCHNGEVRAEGLSAASTWRGYRDECADSRCGD